MHVYLNEQAEDVLGRRTHSFKDELVATAVGDGLHDEHSHGVL